MGFLDDKEELKDKDLFFDPAAKACSSKGKKATREFIDFFLHVEKHKGLRQRSRKAKDTEILNFQLEAIVANIVAGHLRKKPTPIAITLSKQTIGRASSHPILNDKLRSVLDLLDETSGIKFKLGSYSEHRLSTISVGPFIESLISKHALVKSDFIAKDRNPVILRETKTQAQRTAGRRGTELELPDTPETRRLVQEVIKFNEFLDKQAIEYIGSKEAIDDERKSVHRVFNNGKLTDGGRIYGGFWQQLSGAKDCKDDEREVDILINGEHLVGLDYGQIAFRILYSFEGIQPEMEDIYILPGWENSREGMKKLMNAMFNDPYNDSSAVRKHFKDRKSLNRGELTRHVKQAINKHHSPIMNHVGGMSTFKVFYEESNHLMRVLLQLVDMNIPALPVHDCLYVRLSDKDLVKELMETSFKEYFKVDIKVK